MIKEKIPQISIFILVILLVIGFVNASDVNETNIHDNAIDNNLNKNLPDYTKSTNNQNNPVLIIDTIKDTHYTDNVSVSGSLKDNNGKYLKDSSDLQFHFLIPRQESRQRPCGRMAPFPDRFQNYWSPPKNDSHRACPSSSPFRFLGNARNRLRLFVKNPWRT